MGASKAAPKTKLCMQVSLFKDNLRKHGKEVRHGRETKKGFVNEEVNRGQLSLWTFDKLCGTYLRISSCRGGKLESLSTSSFHHWLRGTFGVLTPLLFQPACESRVHPIGLAANIQADTQEVPDYVGTVCR